MSSYNRCPSLISNREDLMSEGTFPACPYRYHTLIQPTSAGCNTQPVFLLHNKSTNDGSMLITQTESTGYNERQIRLLEYLESRVKSGANFFKSKYIARETGMSSKEVGTNMGLLAETCTRFSIRKYSYSNSTTWLITASQV